MTICIIGSGNVGGALARGLIKAGHTVLIGARLPLSQKSLALASHIGEDRFTQVAFAVKQSEVVIFTVPPDAALKVIEEMGPLGNKVVVDASNSIRSKPDPYPTVFHAVKALAKTDKVVKCFNTTGFENMLNPNYNGTGLDMFCAGDNKEAKALVSGLAKDIGFENCYDFGGDDKVQLLEEFAMCWINLAIMQGHGRNLGIKLLKR